MALLKLTTVSSPSCISACGVTPVLLLTVAILRGQAFEAQLQGTANVMTAPQGVVWKAMVKQHGRVFVMAGLVKLVHDAIMFLGPFVLEQLLKFLENGGSPCESCRCLHKDSAV